MKPHAGKKSHSFFFETLYSKIKLPTQEKAADRLTGEAIILMNIGSK
jgi:hypothetical protein